VCVCVCVCVLVITRRRRCLLNIASKLEGSAFDSRSRDLTKIFVDSPSLYMGAGKSLARTGSKQANVSVIIACNSFGALSCRKNKKLVDR